MGLVTKPTLQEIAAMPFPQSEEAMRTYYDPMWGKYSKGDETKNFKVRIEYSWKEYSSVQYDIEAACEEEAKEIAEDKWSKDTSIDGGTEAEVDLVEAEEVGQ